MTYTLLRQGAKTFGAKTHRTIEEQEMEQEQSMKNGIALDGPAGAGKSTLAKLAAKKLNRPYVDTGAMYRAMALCCREQGMDWEDEPRVRALLEKTEIRVTYLSDGQHVLVNGRDVTAFLRTEEMGKGASAVSKLPCVRDAMGGIQRQIAHETGAVLDGREIGTFVIPETPYKFFITADPRERAKRRLLQLKSKGVEGDFDTILRDIEARDYQDAHRAYAPLKQAEDAVLIDTTHMTVEEAVNRIVERVRALEQRMEEK